MMWELMLRGIRKSEIENMTMEEVTELYTYLLHHRKYIIPTELALGIQLALNGD